MIGIDLGGQNSFSENRWHGSTRNVLAENCQLDKDRYDSDVNRVPGICQKAISSVLLLCA